MTHKKLKLKTRLSEEEAALLLSSLIGEEITAEELGNFARNGVVPAYLTMNQELYPGSTLGFIEVSEYLALETRNVPGRKPREKERVILGEFEFRAWQKEVPIPLHVFSTSDADGEYQFRCVNDSEGNRWVVFAGVHEEGYTSGGSPMELLRDDQCVRVYTPQVIYKVASILNDETACPVWPAVPHGRTTRDGGEYFAGCEDNWTMPFVSPLEKNPLKYVNGEKPSVVETIAEKDSPRMDPRERETYNRILYVLAKKSGLTLERLGADEKNLIEYAAREGMIIPTGKGTIERKLLAAKLLAEQDFQGI